mgnify:CR=1 FL=1
MLLKKLEKKYPKPFKALRIGEKMLDVLDRILLIISILGFLGIGTYTVKENIQQDESYSKVQTSNEFDINDLKIEFTKKGSAIITNNSSYAISFVCFSYKENDYMISNNGVSLRPGDSVTVSTRNYVRDGGYELKEIILTYIDNNGNKKDIIYDAVLGIYE